MSQHVRLGFCSVLRYTTVDPVLISAISPRNSLRCLPLFQRLYNPLHGPRRLSHESREAKKLSFPPARSNATSRTPSSVLHGLRSRAHQTASWTLRGPNPRALLWRRYSHRYAVRRRLSRDEKVTLPHKNDHRSVPNIPSLPSLSACKSSSTPSTASTPNSTTLHDDEKVTKAQSSSSSSSKPILDRLPHLHYLHRPSKEELLGAATGFWSRLKVRFKWATIRSARPFNMDEIYAVFSWILFGHFIWIIVGTTTFFSLAILFVNTVFAQGNSTFTLSSLYFTNLLRNACTVDWELHHQVIRSEGCVRVCYSTKMEQWRHLV